MVRDNRVGAEQLIVLSLTVLVKYWSSKALCDCLITEALLPTPRLLDVSYYNIMRQLCCSFHSKLPGNNSQENSLVRLSIRLPTSHRCCRSF